MTFSIELFACAILGHIIGFAIFSNFQDTKAIIATSGGGTCHGLLSQELYTATGSETRTENSADELHLLLGDNEDDIDLDSLEKTERNCCVQNHTSSDNSNMELMGYRNRSSGTSHLFHRDEKKDIELKLSSPLIPPKKR